ncbi:MAG TPA: GNAT family N-acetyltransferase [Anaeromyxobacter sp.]|nr:GNAT family N-acetyltransferase [Anaeromyxobacter sp.]
MPPGPIRPAVGADLPALALGLAELPLLRRYGRSAARLLSTLETALSRGEGLLLAEQRGLPAGLAWYLPSGTLALGGYLRLLAVLEGFQGRGLGAALLAAYEAEVARESAHSFLLTSRSNEDAQRFYERHGYRSVGLLPALVLPDEDEALYWKRLR